MKSQATSMMLVIAVIVVVGGVAWFRSAPKNATEATNLPPPASSASEPQATAEAPVNPAAEPAVDASAAPIKEGELCPEPPPTANTDEPAANASTDDPPNVKADDSPASPDAAPAETKKLPRMVDLGADKCIPCKKLAPILEELKKEYEGRVVVEFIDVWKNPQAGDPYKIKLIPTQVFFDAEGKEVWRHEGFMPKADFVAKFKEMGVK